MVGLLTKPIRKQVLINDRSRRLLREEQPYGGG